MQHDRSVKFGVEDIYKQTKNMLDAGNTNELVKRLNEQAVEFLDFVNSNNQCAYSDRMVEGILNTTGILNNTTKLQAESDSESYTQLFETADKLDRVYNSNFEELDLTQQTSRGR